MTSTCLVLRGPETELTMIMHRPGTSALLLTTNPYFKPTSHYLMPLCPSQLINYQTELGSKIVHQKEGHWASGQDRRIFPSFLRSLDLEPCLSGPVFTKTCYTLSKEDKTEEPSWNPLVLTSQCHSLLLTGHLIWAIFSSLCAFHLSLLVFSLLPLQLEWVLEKIPITENWDQPPVMTLLHCTEHQYVRLSDFKREEAAICNNGRWFLAWVM